MGNNSTVVLRKNKALFEIWKWGKQKTSIMIFWDICNNLRISRIKTVKNAYSIITNLQTILCLQLVGYVGFTCNSYRAIDIKVWYEYLQMSRETYQQSSPNYLRSMLVYQIARKTRPVVQLSFDAWEAFTLSIRGLVVQHISAIVIA